VPLAGAANSAAAIALVWTAALQLPVGVLQCQSAHTLSHPIPVLAHTPAAVSARRPSPLPGDPFAMSAPCEDLGINTLKELKVRCWRFHTSCCFL
jgi:hypothetical protein